MPSAAGETFEGKVMKNVYFVNNDVGTALGAVGLILYTVTGGR